MKTPVLFFRFLLSAVPLVFSSSCKPTPEKTGIVEISADQEITLINYSNFEIIAARVDGRSAAYLSDYSLLSTSFDSDQFMFLYRLEDGDKVDLRIDGDLLFIDDTVRSISLSDDESRNFATWFASASREELQSVDHVVVDDENLERYETELLAIAAVNPNFGHWLWESGYEGEFANPPKPLIAGTGMNIAIDDLDLSETAFLIIDEDSDPEDLAALVRQSLPDLYHLGIPMNAEAQVVLDLFSEARTVTDWDLGDKSSDDLPNLENLRNLHELHINIGDSDAILNLNQLPNPQGLRMLSIMGNWDRVKGHEALTNLEYLNPGTISGDQLESIVSANPELIFLDLSYTEVESLKPVVAARGLQALVLGEVAGDPDFTPLRALEYLRFIALPDEMSSDPEIAARVRASCPNCVVYARLPFCLGSGWLILALPLLALAILLKWALTREN